MSVEVSSSTKRIVQKDRQKTAEADAVEPVYTVSEVAKLWKISDDSVKRMFADESGVLVFHPSKSGATKRRAKMILRIPHSVFERVKNKHTRLVA